MRLTFWRGLTEPNRTDNSMLTSVGEGSEFMTADRGEVVRGGLSICLSCLVFLLIVAPIARSVVRAAEPEYDIVIASGRVVDPESGLNAIRNIGISNGRIQAISEKSLKGRTTIQAIGLVVAPGFIDLHSHGQDEENYRLKAMDGVTTALELEVGTADVDRWYEAREG